MSLPRVEVLNRSTVSTDADVAAIVAACAIQVQRDFTPIYGVATGVSFVPTGQAPSADAWHLVILDDADTAGALGYHDLTASGQPQGKVFARTDIAAGDKLSVTVSHELMELLADPDCNRMVRGPDGLMYCWEVADACEADELGYDIDGVTVSDFQLPCWFHQAYTGQCSFRGHLTYAFQLLPDGYIGTYDPRTGQWGQKAYERAGRAHKHRQHLHPVVGSRMERRHQERHRFVRSEPRI